MDDEKPLIHNIFPPNKLFGGWAVLILWIPYFLIFGVLIFYGLSLYKPLLALFATEDFWLQSPPVKGKDALDQTSVMEFMLWGAVLLFASFSYAILLRKKSDENSLFARLAVKLPLIAPIVSAFVFWTASFVLLLPIINSMGWTSPRFWGLVCGGFFICFSLSLFSAIFLPLSIRIWKKIWFVGMLVLNLFILNGGTYITGGITVVASVMLIGLCAFYLFRDFWGIWKAFQGKLR